MNERHSSCDLRQSSMEFHVNANKFLFPLNSLAIGMPAWFSNDLGSFGEIPDRRSAGTTLIPSRIRGLVLMPSRSEMVLESERILDATRQCQVCRGRRGSWPPGLGWTHARIVPIQGGAHFQSSSNTRRISRNRALRGAPSNGGGSLGPSPSDSGWIGWVLAEPRR